MICCIKKIQDTGERDSWNFGNFAFSQQSNITLSDPPKSHRCKEEIEGG
jgi:hypothetical protein